MTPFRSQRSDWKRHIVSKKIVVFCPNLIGDTVMATPTFRALRARFPEAISPQSSGPTWRRYSMGPTGSIRQSCFIIARGWRQRTLRSSGNSTLGSDVAILLPNSFRSAWVAWMAGIPRRIGYARYGRSMLLTDSLKPPRDRSGKLLPTPIVECYLALTRVLGCRAGSIRLELATTPEDELVADRAWKHLGSWRTKIGWYA